MPGPHLIGNQIIELEVDSLEEAQAIQDRVSFLYSYRWQALIGEVFDEMLAEDSWLRFSEIELDLGEMNLQEWEEEFPKRLVEALRTYLSKRVPRADVFHAIPEGKAGIQAAQLHVLEQTIRHGHLNAWQQWPAGETLDSIWMQMLRTQPGKLLQVFAQAPQKRVLALRLAKQLSPETLDQFLDTLAAHSSRRIRIYLAELKRHPLFHPSQQGSETLIWATLLEHLARQSSGQFQSQAFLQLLLQRLAHRQQQSLTVVNQRFEQLLHGTDWKKRSWGKDFAAFQTAESGSTDQARPLIWLKQFLSWGYIPVQPAWGIREIRQLFHQLVSEQAEDLKAMFEDLPASSSMVQRLLIITSEAKRKTLIALLIPAYADGMLSVVQTLTEIFSELSYEIGYLSSSVYQASIWEALFQNLLSGSIINPSEQRLITSMIAQLEDRFAIPGLLLREVRSRLQFQETDHPLLLGSKAAQEKRGFGSVAFALQAVRSWVETGILAADSPNDRFTLPQMMRLALAHRPQQVRSLVQQFSNEPLALYRMFSQVGLAERKRLFQLIFGPLASQASTQFDAYFAPHRSTGDLRSLVQAHVEWLQYLGAYLPGSSKSESLNSDKEFPKLEEAKMSGLDLFRHILQHGFVPVSYPLQQRQAVKAILSSTLETEDLQAVLADWVPTQILWAKLPAFFSPAQIREIQAAFPDAPLPSPQATSRTSSLQQKLAALTFLLRKQTVPWWADQKKQHWQAFLKEEPEAVSLWLLKLGQEAAVRKQLLQEMGMSQYEIFLRYVSPMEPDMWLQMGEDLHLLQQQTDFSPLPSQQFKLAVFRRMTEALLLSGGKAFSSHRLITQVIHHLPLKPGFTPEFIMRGLEELSEGTAVVYQRSLQEAKAGGLQEQWERLDWLLQHRSPSPSSEGMQLSDLIQSLLAEAPQAAGSKLRSFLRDESAAMHLISNLSPATIEALLPVLAPSGSSQLQKQMKDLLTLSSRIHFQQLSPLHVQRRIQAEALQAAALLQTGEKAFVVRVLQHLAKAEGLTPESLAASLVKILEQVSHLAHSNLPKILAELAKSAVLLAADFPPLPHSKTPSLTTYPSLESSPDSGSSVSEPAFIPIQEAGLVILTPYIGTLFARLLLSKAGKFLSPFARERAPLILHYLASGQTHAHEHELVLHKLLCGMEAHVPIATTLELTESEQATCQGLLQAITQAWPSMKNSSIAALQESFLQRAGLLRPGGQGWQLSIERKPFDVLLQTLPWSFSTVKLSFMKGPLFVEW